MVLPSDCVAEISNPGFAGIADAVIAASVDAKNSKDFLSALIIFINFKVKVVSSTNLIKICKTTKRGWLKQPTS
jgi:hypothetical protein